mgnify:FL=1
MTVRLSTGLRDKLLNGGASGGLKNALSLGFIAIYSGPQPLTADSAASGTLLGTVSVGGAGVGLTFGNSVSGTIAKTPAEDWKFTGLVDGTAGWFRFYPAAGNPALSSATEARIDGSIASSGGDLNISNIAVKIGVPSTVDVFQFTMPAQ